METLKLQDFCGEKNIYDLSKPWSSQNYTYASNGVIFLRVPRREAVPVNIDNVEQLSTKFYAYLERFKTEDGFQFLPNIKPVQKCLYCHGAGWFFGKDCPDCNGTGEVKFFRGSYKYEDDCKNCSGIGKIPGGVEQTFCEFCDGMGVCFCAPYEYKISTKKFHVRVLHKIKNLPNVRINCSALIDFPVIHFDGGDGVVMPLADI